MNTLLNYHSLSLTTKGNKMMTSCFFVKLMRYFLDLVLLERQTGNTCQPSAFFHPVTLCSFYSERQTGIRVIRFNSCNSCNS